MVETGTVSETQQGSFWQQTSTQYPDVVPSFLLGNDTSKDEATGFLMNADHDDVSFSVQDISYEIAGALQTSGPATMKQSFYPALPRKTWSTGKLPALVKIFGTPAPQTEAPMPNSAAQADRGKPALTTEASMPNSDVQANHKWIFHMSDSDTVSHPVDGKPSDNSITSIPDNFSGPTFGDPAEWIPLEPLMKVYISKTKQVPKLREGRNYLLWDIGSPGNITGRGPARQKAQEAFDNGRKCPYEKRDVPLKVSGVGNSSKACNYNIKLACALKTSDVYMPATFESPVIGDADTPSVLGVNSMREMRTIIDTNTFGCYIYLVQATTTS